MTRVSILLALSLAAGCGLAAATLPFGIVDVSGNVSTVFNCSSLVSGNCEATDVTVFLEQLNHVVSPRIRVDIGSAPGTYTSTDPLLPAPSFLSANEVLDSYFVHFDPISPLGNVNRVGEIVFDPGLHIVGIQAVNASLNIASSAQLQRSGVTYDTTTTYAHGVEFTAATNPDWIRIVDPQTIQFSLNVSGTNVDDFRILVETPEPASFALIGTGLVGLTILRRRKQRR